MPSATSLTGNELVPIVQGGINKNASVNLLGSSYLPLSGGTLTGALSVENIYSDVFRGCEDHSIFLDYSSSGGALVLGDVSNIYGGAKIVLSGGSTNLKGEVITPNNILDDGSGNLTIGGTGSFLGGAILFQQGSNGEQIQIGTGSGYQGGGAQLDIIGTIAIAAAGEVDVGNGGIFTDPSPGNAYDIKCGGSCGGITSLGGINANDGFMVNNSVVIDGSSNATFASVSVGGGSNQFLKGDGTLDSTSYQPSFKSTGSVTLVSGTKAVTISGLTSSNQAFIQLKTTGGTLGNGYKAVCTTGTLTITSVVAAGTTQTLDTSTLNYLVL